ncbi:N-6 DNA methylase [Furfurilactobacillus milii]|uniref:N-6 DNA methylase n=1 Tax=Furfurilactobacillus milii TaxID=2888272 RepID=UPI001F329084|nr:N-6 DNA methylase [Furfurilactobacillus milii]MCF6419798.1 SAM-dependent methyltransferase [Furfurilactobacillus milii]
MKEISKQKQFLNLKAELSTASFWDDFAIMASTSISNACVFDKSQEASYLEVVRKYSAIELEKFIQCLAITGKALAENPHDFLGEVIQKDQSNKNDMDQFFTPSYVSSLMAGLIDEDSDTLTVCDPTCGTGSLVIGEIAYLKEKGVDYEKRLQISCSDLDKTVLRLCYVQLSLLNVKARCEVKDFFKGKAIQTLYTPACYNPENKINEQMELLG